jgi:hypothetical protein
MREEKTLTLLLAFLFSLKREIVPTTGGEAGLCSWIAAPS